MPHDPILHLLGLAKKAGRLEIGEEPVGAAARAHQARVLLLAADAAANTVRRAAHFGEAGGALWLQMPFTKAELGEQLGRSSCAMLAVTDFGFAAALAEKLAARDEERYGPAAQQLRAEGGPRPDAPERKTPAREKYETGQAQALRRPSPLAPELRGKRPRRQRRRRERGQRRLKADGRRRPETGDGKSAPNVPRETGAGRAEADCEAQIRRQEPCRETLRNEVALYDEQIPCPRGGQGLQAEFQGHRGDHDQIQPDPQEPHAGPGGAGAGRYFRLSDPAQPGGAA